MNSVALARAIRNNLVFFFKFAVRVLFSRASSDSLDMIYTTIDLSVCQWFKGKYFNLVALVIMHKNLP